MKNQDSSHRRDKFVELRKRAEEIQADTNTAKPESDDSDNIKSLLSELQIHQIELEMQNDELRQAHEQLLQEREKYVDLYNFAPVAYFTFDKDDLMVDLNLAAAELLGNEPRFLINRPLASHLTPESLQNFVQHRQQAYVSQKPQTCELTVRRRNGTQAIVQARTIALQTGKRQLWRTVMTDITIRKQIEESLLVKDRAINTSINGIAILDLDGKVTYVNPSLLSMWKYADEQEVIGKHFSEFWQLKQAAEQVTQALLRRGNWLGELIAKREDLSTFNAQVSASIVTDETGTPLHMLASVLDITLHKQAEKELSTQTQILNMIFESAPYILLLVDEDGRVKNINKAGVTYTGREKEELLGLLGGDVFQCLNSFHGLGCGRNDECKKCPVRSRVTHTFQTGKNFYNAEGSLTVLRDGNPVTLHFLISTTLVDIKDAKQTLVAIVDITQRKQMEQELASQKQKLDNIITGTNVGTWEWNIQTGETIFNERWAEIIGYSLDEIAPISIDTWLKFAHPEDLDVSNKLLEKHFKGETDFYEHESRMLHKNGNWVWVLDRGRVFTWTSDRKPLLMFGTHQEITERKKAEEELQKTNKILQSKLTEIEALQDELREQALRDPLTNLYNRRYLVETLQHELSRARRSKKSVSVIIMDIDRFKKINDNYGHQRGDNFLLMVADMLRTQTRDFDFACRYGGEEFLLVLPGTTARNAVKRAEQIRRQCADIRIQHESKELSITISMGVATYPLHSKSVDELLIKADKALYRSKRSGRNRVTVWKEK